MSDEVQTLAGRTVLVTGGSRGIGRAIAVLLAGRGADVVLNYVRHDEAAQEARRAIEAQGRRCVLARANLGEPRQVEELIDAAATFATGGIYAFIHAAAIGVFKPALAVRSNQFDLAMSVNARSFLDSARRLRPVMTENDARMIAISSRGASSVIRDYGPVGVSKAALEALVRYLAFELGPGGIRVNAVSSGLVDTDAARSFRDADERLRRARDETPLGRLGEPDDIARAVALLCSADAAWITGQVVVADGGHGLIAR